MGKPFVQATYFLEGDGFLAPYAYVAIQDLLNMTGGNFVHPKLTAAIDAEVDKQWRNGCGSSMQ